MPRASPHSIILSKSKFFCVTPRPCADLYPRVGGWIPEIIIYLAKPMIKFEFGNPKSETIPNSEFSNDQNGFLARHVSNFARLEFEFASKFGFRASNLRPLHFIGSLVAILRTT
jgi:hypothetical protein